MKKFFTFLLIIILLGAGYIAVGAFALEPKEESFKLTATEVTEAKVGEEVKVNAKLVNDSFFCRILNYSGSFISVAKNKAGEAVVFEAETDDYKSVFLFMQGNRSKEIKFVPEEAGDYVITVACDFTSKGVTVRKLTTVTFTVTAA